MAKGLTFQEVREGLFDQIFNEWVDPFPGGPQRTPIQLPNQQFNPPEDNIWLRAVLTFGEGIETTLNPSPLNRVPGILSLDIVDPIRDGTTPSFDLADKAINMFNRRTVEPGIQMRASSMTSLVTEDPYWIVRVTTPFWFFTIGNCIP